MGNKMIRCMGCMNTFSSEYDMCPYCGYAVGAGVENAMHMLPGTVLADRYILGRVVGFGGFGITYIAWDKTLYQRVAIKEYLPSEFSTRSAGQTMVTVFSGDKTIQFKDGLGKFVDEAKRLAKFQNDNGIVRVFDSFEANNTAYIVMEYLEGETLAKYLEREGKVPPEQAIKMVMPVIKALATVHEKGIIHRDIAPDNVFLTSDGKVKLIDFGAARYATTTKSRSLTVIIKPGYSPEEQYRSRGDQGPHTDVYSVGSLLYRMITGETPPDALERRAYYEKSKKDILTPIQKYAKTIPQNRANAIYNAMNVLIEDRTPDMETLEKELTTSDRVPRRGNTIRKTDPLTWPLWAKFGVPAAIIVMTALVIVFAFLWKDSWNIPDGQTMVPKVVSKDTDYAEKKLEENELGFLIADKIENDVIEKNKILSQDVEAGSITEIDTVVRVVISAGRGDEVVPNVTGMLFDEAKEQLEALGFVVKKKMQKSSEAKDSVIKQSVGENELLEIGSTITLTVSKGSEVSEQKAVDIPELVGMDLDAAKAKAEDLELTVVVKKYEYSDSVPEGQIMAQSPKAGTSGLTGDSIELTVSQGVAKGVMPDVYGRKESSAIELLKSRNIKYKVVDGYNARVDDGVVYAQSVEEGKEVDPDTVVSITVCRSQTTTTRAATTTTTTTTTTAPATTSPATTQSSGFTYSNQRSTSQQMQNTQPVQQQTMSTYQQTMFTAASQTQQQNTAPSMTQATTPPAETYSQPQQTQAQPVTSNLWQTNVTSVLNSSSYTVSDGRYTVSYDNGKIVAKDGGSVIYADDPSNQSMLLSDIKSEILGLKSGYTLSNASGSQETYTRGSSTLVIVYSSGGLDHVVVDNVYKSYSVRPYAS